MQRAPLLVSFALLAGCDMPSSTPAPVTLAVVNAHIWTGDARQPWAEAIAVSGEEIAAVGLGSEIRKRLAADTRVIDAHGQMVVPGITVEDALRAYTSGAAYAEFAESRKGTLERGKLADFVILDRDLTRIAPETIRDAKVVMTVVGGKIVYENPAGR
jgi:predicted amidohydrolase YtcJ